MRVVGIDIFRGTIDQAMKKQGRAADDSNFHAESPLGQASFEFCEQLNNSVSPQA